MVSPFTPDEIMAVLPDLSPQASTELKMLLLEARCEAYEGAATEEEEEGSDG